MKKINLISLCLLLVFACNNKDVKNNTGEIPVVDVTKTYHKKELKLQEVADIEYIPLETNDSVLLEEHAKPAYISKDTIIVCNGTQGDIFIFSGKGKFLSKFNKKGQGGDEYNGISDLLFAPNKQEVLVFDKWSSKKVYIYDLKGNFKRSFEMGSKYTWENITDYNDSLLLCYDNHDNLFFGKRTKDKGDNPQPFIFMSKLDGHFVRSINLDVKNKFKTTVVNMLENAARIHKYKERSFNKLNNEYIINHFALDTVYRFTKDESLVPFITKQPSTSTMPDDKKIWLDILAVSNNHLFMKSASKTGNKDGAAYNQTTLYIDRKTGEIFNYQLIDTENSNNEKLLLEPYLITADKLVDALSENQLSGKLKELAQKIDADDNHVLVKISLK